MENLVSIIIPIYKAEKHLPKCLDSIINQSYKNLEIICVNDCSPDNSLSVLNDYMQKDERIKIIDLKKNGGASNARNSGLEIASGDYICFIDSDDWIEREYISTLFSLFEDDIQITSVGFKWAKRDKNIIKNSKKNFSGCFSGYDTLIQTVSDKYFWCVLWNKMFRKSLIENHRFNSSLSLMEDLVFLIQVLADSNKDKIKIKYSNKKLYHYVFSPDSLSCITPNINKCKQNERALNVFEKLIKDLESDCSLKVISALKSWEFLTLMQIMYSYRKNKSYDNFWRCQKKARSLLKDYMANVKLFSGFRKLGFGMFFLMSILTKPKFNFSFLKIFKLIKLKLEGK